MMELYILRHCHAYDIDGKNIKTDSDRPLNEKGVQAAQKLREKIQAIDLKIETIMSSPILRARQTAEAVFPNQPIQFFDSLSTSGSLERALSDLKEQKKNQAIIIGHEPLLSRLISLLISGDESTWVHFKKGALCKLTVHEVKYGKCAELEWLLIPKLI